MEWSIKWDVYIHRKGEIVDFLGAARVFQIISEDSGFFKSEPLNPDRRRENKVVSM